MKREEMQLLRDLVAPTEDLQALARAARGDLYDELARYWKQVEASADEASIPAAPAPYVDQLLAITDAGAARIDALTAELAATREDLALEQRRNAITGTGLIALAHHVADLAKAVADLRHRLDAALAPAKREEIN